MKRRHWLVLGAAAATGVSAKPSVASVGQPAPAFTALDAAGQQRSLAEFKGKLIVLEWSSASCPFAAAQYRSGRMPELQRWAKRHGVAWLTVLSSHRSRADYLGGAQAEAFDRKRGGEPTALLVDDSGALGRAYGALTANHMFVIAANGTLAYAGGIDDSQSMVPDEVRRSHNHVRSALEDLLGGRAVATPKTDPYGCSLAYG